MIRRLFCVALAALLSLKVLAWVPSYSNPVLHMDYSDPDVCRVGEDYYMTASSFNCFPGLPILHSRDLVHWELVGAALTDYPGGEFTAPEDDFRTTVQHGKGVWAPAIRYHDGWYYIFCGDPDRGIFMVRTQDPAGRWEPPVWVVKAKGFIDPCPLWDDDGRAWLSHGCAGSRAGLKSVLFLAEMAPDGTHLLEPSRIIYDGHLTQPTIEGTKLYKRDGWYYIFSPAGGVATGWQTVLRSRALYGPWEEKIVLAWAPGTINGPHQGAWVDTPDGEDWFLHFQDKGAYGRILHLQPMGWAEDGWPYIGDNSEGDGTGHPVKMYRRKWPRTANGIQKAAPEAAPRGAAEEPSADISGAGGHAQEGISRRGDSSALGGTPARPGEAEGYRPYGLDLAWQYAAVPSPYWHMALPDGSVRLYCVEQKWPYKSLWDCPNLLSQKFGAEKFTVTARLSFRPNPQLASRGEKAGFVVSGDDYAGLQLTDTPQGALLQYISCTGASRGGAQIERDITVIPWRRDAIDHGRESRNVPLVDYPDVCEAVLYVRLDVSPRQSKDNVPVPVCSFSWSTDGRRWHTVGGTFDAMPELWIGAKWGFYALRPAPKNDSGWLDVTLIQQ